MHNQLARISHSFPQVSNSAQNWLEKTMITGNAETNALLKHSLTIFFKIEYEKRHMERYIWRAQSIIQLFNITDQILEHLIWPIPNLHDAFLLSLSSSIQKVNKVQTSCHENWSNNLSTLNTGYKSPYINAFFAYIFFFLNLTVQLFKNKIRINNMLATEGGKEFYPKK